MLITPNLIVKEKNKECIYSLYDRLLQDRIIYLFGEIDENQSASITAQLMYLESVDNEKDIQLYINSSGGSVSAGFAIYDVMCKIKPDISTVCVGSCYSMAAFLLAGGTKGKRHALANSEIMLHQPLSGISGQASDIEIASKRIQKVKNRLNNILALNTNKSIDEILEATDRDNFMFSEDALSFGLIDKII